MKKNKNFLSGLIVLLLTMTIISCNTPSEKHVELENAQTQLEENINMYKTVWNKVINERQIDLINGDSFDENITS